jgi:hypothetical protein
MKRLLPTLIIWSVFCATALAGTEFSEKAVKQASSLPEWYGDNELTVNLWGAYAFTQTDSDPNHDLFDLALSQNFGTFDRYLGDDHAWGGGVDIKYFFHRYFGIGIRHHANHRSDRSVHREHC